MLPMESGKMKVISWSSSKMKEECRTVLLDPAGTGKSSANAID